jgi:hypothetical protein
MSDFIVYLSNMIYFTGPIKLSMTFPSGVLNTVYLSNSCYSVNC